MKNLFLLLPLFTTLLPAQPSIEWQKCYGGTSYDEAYSIEQTSDGGYIVAGSALSSNGDIFGNHGGDDFWVLKLSNTGAIQWKKTLGGTDNEVAVSIHQTMDGGYIVAGYTGSNNFDVSGNHGGFYDGWIVKLSSGGIIQWQRALGGSGVELIWQMQVTADNGYILAGSSNSTDGDVTENKGYYDFWVVKLSETGTIEWQKTLGGSGEDEAKAVKQTADGGYIVVGKAGSNDGDVTDLHGNVDYWAVKLSAAGILEWQKTLGGLHGDIGNDVLQSSDGGYVVTGYAGSNSGDITGQHGILDFWTAKLSSTGELEWQKALGGTERDYGRSIVASSDGGYLVLGETHSIDGDVVGNLGSVDFWLVKLSSAGEVVWKKTYGGTDQENGLSINNTSDNGFIMAGYSWSNDLDVTPPLVTGKANFWVVKLAPESVSTQAPPSALAGHLEIFPNPAQQSVSLHIASETSALSVSVSDMLGRVALLRQEIPNGGTLNLDGLAPGLYIVSAVAADGKAYIGRVAKE